MMAREIHPKWFRSFVTLEADAVALHEFELQAVPGLLQTEAYARANLAASWPPKSAQELEESLAARLERQQILERESPPMLWFVLDQSVLMRPVGTAAVMAEQMQRLLSAAELPYVRLLVLPLSRSGSAPMNGQFTVLELPRRERLAIPKVRVADRSSRRRRTWHGVRRRSTRSWRRRSRWKSPPS